MEETISGSQYCSDDYQRLLKAHGIVPSMSGKGNCYDNAMVETVFKTIKSEMIWRTSFQTRSAAELALGRYIDGFYNPSWRHFRFGIQIAAFEARAPSRRERTRDSAENCWAPRGAKLRAPTPRSPQA